MGTDARTSVRSQGERARQLVRLLLLEAEEIKRGEVERALRRMDADDEVESAIEDAADAIVERVLGHPTERTLAAANEGEVTAVETAEELFELGGLE